MTDIKEAQGLEVVAWQDAENPLYTTGEKRQMHGWATDGYPIVELIRLSDATALIDQLRERVIELESQQSATAQPQINAVPEKYKMQPYQTVDKGSTNYKAGWNACINAMLAAAPAQPQSQAVIEQGKARIAELERQATMDGGLARLALNAAKDQLASAEAALDKAQALNVELRDQLKAQPQSDAVPDAAMSICGDTGCAEVDSLIGRLMSSDPDFEDCTAASALLRRLFLEEIRGPKGHATWKDAAIAERVKRVAMRPSPSVVVLAREGLEVYSGPNMNEHKVCAEIVRLAAISDAAAAQPQSDQDYIHLCAALYQACGAYDMPERVLDALSAAANAQPFIHLVDGILPCMPDQPQSDDAMDGLVDAVKDVLDHLNDGHSIHSGTGLHSCLQAAYRALLGGDHE